MERKQIVTKKGRKKVVRSREVINFESKTQTKTTTVKQGGRNRKAAMVAKMGLQQGQLAGKGAKFQDKQDLLQWKDQMVPDDLIEA